MGIRELAAAIGTDAGSVSRWAKRGMPTTSVDAANAWREINAPPRAKRGGHPGPVKPRDPIVTIPERAPCKPVKVCNTTNSPEDSLQRAKANEVEAYQRLREIQQTGGSVEDIRKAHGVYVSARNNRTNAQRDFEEWRRLEGITLLRDEARELILRPAVVAKSYLDTAAKTLAPRLYGQTQREIEKALAEWIDTLAGVLNAEI